MPKSTSGPATGRTTVAGQVTAKKPKVVLRCQNPECNRVLAKEDGIKCRSCSTMTPIVAKSSFLLKAVSFAALALVVVGFAGWFLVAQPALHNYVQSMIQKLDATNQQLDAMNQQLDATKQQSDVTKLQLDLTNLRSGFTNQQLDFTVAQVVEATCNSSDSVKSSGQTIVYNAKNTPSRGIGGPYLATAGQTVIVCSNANISSIEADYGSIVIDWGNTSSAVIVEDGAVAYVRDVSEVDTLGGTVYTRNVKTVKVIDGGTIFAEDGSTVYTRGNYRTSHAVVWADKGSKVYWGLDDNVTDNASEGSTLCTQSASDSPWSCSLLDYDEIVKP